jgi:two-component system response regulator
MPKMDGLEASGLKRSGLELRRTPEIVLSTSKAEEDIFQTYDLGVNSFTCKPVHFQKLVEITKEIENYWVGTVALPPK